MSDITPEQRQAFESQQRGFLGEQATITLFTSFGWSAQKLTLDEGEDLLVEVKDDFRATGLKFHVQVKTPKTLAKAKNGSFYYEIETKHLQHWAGMIPPVFILLWEIGKNRGYWVAVPDVIAELNKQNTQWQTQTKVRVFFPLSNTTHKKGLKELRLRAANLVLPSVAQGKELQVHLTFDFPATPAGKKDSQELLHHFKTGEKATISGKHLVELRKSVWYEKLYGAENTNYAKVQFSIGPTHSERWTPMRLTVLSESGKRIAQQAISARAVAIGNEQVRFSNAEKPTPFFFEMIARTDRHYSVNISFEKSISSARELRDAFPFFDALGLERTLRVEALQEKEYGKEWIRVEIPLSAQEVERESTLPIAN